MQFSDKAAGFVHTFDAELWWNFTILSNIIITIFYTLGSKDTEG